MKIIATLGDQQSIATRINEINSVYKARADYLDADQPIDYLDAATGCPNCGVAYSFFYATQFHKVNCQSKNGGGK